MLCIAANRTMLLYSIVILNVLEAVLATERPIIGILTQEVSPKSTVEAQSLIAASYVKAVEQAGARVVPIFINKTDSYYRNLLGQINGVVFPGGAVLLNSSGYSDAGKIIIDYAKEVNSNGDHFPILGVCLGFELLVYAEVNSYSVLGYCNSSNVALPLVFKEDFKQSKLYSKASKDIINILSHLPVTFNAHQYCTTEALLSEFNLTKKWHVLSTSIDLDGKEFVSSIEHRKFPIAGVQFHPEKNAYEWSPKANLPHSYKAIHSARLFYDWLVGEARRNNHSFSNSTEESQALVYNYSQTYTRGYFEQIYYFK